MSDPIRIALIAEGATDKIVIEAALEALLPQGTAIILRQLQPDTPEDGVLGGSADATAGIHGGGWGGVCRWCRSVPELGAGNLIAAAQLSYDFVIIHLDVDVSRGSYTQPSIIPCDGMLPLPCAKPCPPASASADALKEVVKSWLAPVTTEANVLWCLPAYNTETWGYAAWRTADARGLSNLECQRDIPQKLKSHVEKTKRKYLLHQHDITTNWATVEELCPQAKAFSDAVRTVILPSLQ